MKYHQFRHQPLARAIEAIVAAGGSEAREAQLVADNLVLANLLGHDSHGIGMVPRYIAALLEGGPSASPRGRSPGRSPCSRRARCQARLVRDDAR
jgi:LDH2 family malate/lactate/ureidoglycolate dehydrogenase